MPGKPPRELLGKGLLLFGLCGFLWARLSMLKVSARHKAGRLLTP